jgi:ferrous iron transport protein A
MRRHPRLIPMNMPFNQLQVGDKARVNDFKNVPESYRNRLLSLGLTPGTPFLVQHRAPLGDPIAILVRGFRLSLRSHEAAGLLVDKL